MFRRIVCLLLVPVLLANQAAMCCAHTHQYGETDDHPTRAHVHLSGGSHGPHSDGHRHGATCEHRHSDYQPVECSDDNLDFNAELPIDHDSDALFFGRNISLPIPPNRITVDVPTFFPVYLDAELLPLSSTEKRSQVTRAGPFSYHCAIFVQTCRLLL